MVHKTGMPVDLNIRKAISGDSGGRLPPRIGDEGGGGGDDNWNDGDSSDFEESNRGCIKGGLSIMVGFGMIIVAVLLASDCKGGPDKRTGIKTHVNKNQMDLCKVLVFEKK